MVFVQSRLALSFSLSTTLERERARNTFCVVLGPLGLTCRRSVEGLSLVSLPHLWHAFVWSRVVEIFASDRPSLFAKDRVLFFSLSFDDDVVVVDHGLVVCLSRPLLDL